MSASRLEFVSSFLFIAIIIAGAMLELSVFVVVPLAFAPLVLDVAWFIRRENRRAADAAAEEAERRIAEKPTEPAEKTLAQVGSLAVRLIDARRLVLDDEDRPGERVLLIAPGDEAFVEPEVGPIEPRLQPEGYAYSREIVEASIDSASRLIRVRYRITAWESRYIPRHWEYSHAFEKRYEWDATSGAFVGSREADSAGAVEERAGESDPGESFASKNISS